MVEFQKVEYFSVCFPFYVHFLYSGRQIRYGIREFAMAAYFPVFPGREGGVLPIYSTFFMFTSYALNAIRMAALQKLRTAMTYHFLIWVFTHTFFLPRSWLRLTTPLVSAKMDLHTNLSLLPLSSGLYETHDFGVQQTQKKQWPHVSTPLARVKVHILCLSRQALPLLEHSNRQGAWRGAYVVEPEPSGTVPKLVSVATGSEVRTSHQSCAEALFYVP
jgi:transketolase